MDFNYSEEQLALRDSLRRMLDKEYAFDARRAIAASAEGMSRDMWAKFAELGVTALPLPESHGGFTADGAHAGVDIMMIMESLGRSLVVEPYLATVVLAAGLVRDTGSEAQKEAILPAIAGGELAMALAHYEAGGRYALSHVATRARREGDAWVLDGRKAVVLNGGQADRLIVSARSGGETGSETGGNTDDAAGISLFLVDRGAPGLTVRSYATQDGGRAADISLDGVRVAAADMLGAEGGALPAIERTIDQGCAALCAEAVGIMDALNAATLDYLKTRKQFGQPIGRFQALQHRMVDMVIAAEQARSMAILAAVSAGSNNDAERRRGVAAAKAYVGHQARFVGQQAVQLHGGMGVTDELMASHLFKRLTLINLSLGDADHHLARFSDSLILPA